MMRIVVAGLLGIVLRTIGVTVYDSAFWTILVLFIAYGVLSYRAGVGYATPTLTSIKK